MNAYAPYHLASASAGETLDLIALRTAFFTGVGFFAFFATGFFFTTGFFTTGFLPSSANGFVGRLGSDGPSAFFAAGFFAAGLAVVFLTVVFLTAVFLAGAFFGAGVARLDRAAFTCIVRVERVCGCDGRDDAGRRGGGVC